MANCNCGKWMCRSAMVGLIAIGAIIALGIWATPAYSDNHSTNTTAVTEEPPGFALLPEMDRKHALDQKFCPVMGTELGKMGPPIKVTIDGYDVFVCCDACKMAVERDPEKYLKKAEELKAENQRN